MSTILAALTTPTPILAQQTADTGQAIEGMLLAVLFLIFITWLGGAMANREDKSWLPGLVVWAFVAKLIGSLARYFMVTVLYGGGDSIRYHNYGTIFAEVWRNLAVPVSVGDKGTAFTDVATGLIYAIYTPTYLGGFLIFALLSFLGQLFFYAAFRPWFGSEKQKLYAKAVLLFPSLIFWPSSIGKDALMVLGLGMASYGASLMLRNYGIGSLFLLAPGLYLGVSIRSHIAGIFGLALVLGLLLGKAPKQMQGHPRRALVILTALLGAAALLATFSTTFGVTVEGGEGTRDPTEFLEDVSDRTSTGGSQIGGDGGIASPAQLPLAIVTVLFRPLLHEGGSAQIIASALEGTALLGLVIWKLPTMWRNKRLLREKPFLMMCFFYTGGFVLAFSAILNLGILARQRVQVLPFFLALIVALGWDEAKKTDGEVTKPDGRAPRRPPVPLMPAGPERPIEGLPSETRDAPAGRSRPRRAGPETAGPARGRADGQQRSR